MTPQEARRSIGQPVTYRSHEYAAPEFGVITGVSDNGWVFVQYGTDSHSKATSASQLKLEASPLHPTDDGVGASSATSCPAEAISPPTSSSPHLNGAS